MQWNVSYFQDNTIKRNGNFSWCTGSCPKLGSICCWKGNSEDEIASVVGCDIHWVLEQRVAAFW